MNFQIKKNIYYLKKIIYLKKNFFYYKFLEEEWYEILKSLNGFNKIVCINSETAFQRLRI